MLSWVGYRRDSNEDSKALKMFKDSLLTVHRVIKRQKPGSKSKTRDRKYWQRYQNHLVEAESIAKNYNNNNSPNHAGEDTETWLLD